MYRFDRQAAKRRRRALGWSLDDVARRMRTSRQRVAYIESGRHTPSANAVGALAAALGVEPGALYRTRGKASGPRPRDGAVAALTTTL